MVSSFSSQVLKKYASVSPPFLVRSSRTKQTFTLSTLILLVKSNVQYLKHQRNGKSLPLQTSQRQVFELLVIDAAHWNRQTSITIDDVIYVIDAGKVKETNYDPDTGLSKLTEQWITRAAARQRRGRAGRTKPGICYKLYTRKQEENMRPFPVPEILRIPLESISLVVRVMRENEDVRVGSCARQCVRRLDLCRISQHFLKKAIEPPDVSAMDKAWSTLQELGAVDKESKLTALGRHMASS